MSDLKPHAARQLPSWLIFDVGRNMKTQVTMADLRRRAWWVIAAGVLAFVAALGGGAYWSHAVVPKTLEYQRAMAFVRENPSIRKEFGEIAGIEHAGRVSWSIKGRQRSGTFDFAIRGAKDTGAVRVSWKYLPESTEFVVTKLYRTKPLDRSGTLALK